MNFAQIIHRCFSKAEAYRYRSRRKRALNRWMHAFPPGPAVGGATLLLLAGGGQAQGEGFPANLHQPGPAYQQQAGPAYQQQTRPTWQPTGPAWQPTPFRTTAFAAGDQQPVPHQPAPHDHSVFEHGPHQHAPHQHGPFSHAPHQPDLYEPGPYQPGFCEPVPCAPVTCQPAGLYGGIEFLWMRAHFDQNVAMVIDPVPGNESVPFDYSYELSPRAWIGWQGANHGGFRATYWQFDERADTETATAVAGATPIYVYVEGAGGNLTRNAFAQLDDTMVSTHELDLQTLDLELTERFQLSSLQILAGAGVRLAQMEQEMLAEVFTDAGVLEEAVGNNLDFQGAGPTVSLQARRPIGASRFSVYSGLRGSLLFGETRQEIYEMKGAGANIVTDVDEHDEVLSVGELALGLEYARPIGTQAQWFARTGYEVQAWFDAGGPVDSESTLTLDGISFATGFLY